MRFKNLLPFFLSVCILVPSVSFSQKSEISQISKQIDELLWNKISKSVREGDFETYANLNHPNAVLVSSAKSVTMKEALANWKQGFVDSKNGKQKVNVEFRFSKRLDNETTAHQTGIFNFITYEIGTDKIKSEDYVNFEALLVKYNGFWQIMMEYQKTKASREEWEALK